MKRLSTQCMNEIENKTKSMFVTQEASIEMKQKPKRKENNAASANT